MPLITDLDLLRIEPTVFSAAASAGTNLLTATDAAIAGTTLSSASSDFAAAAIDAAHVAIFDGEALEVVSRLSATELEVSRPRDKSATDKISPASASNKTVKVNSFARLIERTQLDLLQALGVHDDEQSLPLTADEVINPEPLASVLTLRVLARAFAAAAALDPDDATLAGRAALYAAQANHAAASVAVLLDLDGDGEADATRRLSVAALRRL
jgi:hypothetical protein